MDSGSVTRSLLVIVSLLGIFPFGFYPKANCIALEAAACTTRPAADHPWKCSGRSHGRDEKGGVVRSRPTMRRFPG